MVRWIALAIDLLAFVLGLNGWAYIVWGPPTTVCALWFSGFLKEYPWTAALTVLPILIGLLYVWIERGLYKRKLGRMIFLLCCTLLGFISFIVQFISLQISPTDKISPIQVVPMVILTASATVIATAGIVKRKAIKETI
jgi:hypothetical protein